MGVPSPPDALFWHHGSRPLPYSWFPIARTWYLCGCTMYYIVCSGRGPPRGLVIRQAIGTTYVMVGCEFPVLTNRSIACRAGEAPWDTTPKMYRLINLVSERPSTVLLFFCPFFWLFFLLGRTIRASSKVFPFFFSFPPRASLGYPATRPWALLQVHNTYTAYF